MNSRLTTEEEVEAFYARQTEEDRLGIAQSFLGAGVARLIYNAREVAGLTQKQLADLVGTQQSVIARLEWADYHGHSLTMLARIAFVLGYEVDVRLIPPYFRRHISEKAVQATATLTTAPLPALASARRPAAAAAARESVKRLSIKGPVEKRATATRPGVKLGNAKGKSGKASGVKRASS